MSSEFRKLQNKKYPKLSLNKDVAPDVKYWRKFESPRIVKEYSSITHINFSPVAPHNYVATCAGKIQVFSAATSEVIKTSNRNKENVYGARFRQDGNLMVVGGESGLVQVLAVNNRSILRNLSGHTKATQVCSFSQEPSTIYSASDDKTVRIWDMSTSKEVSCIKAHKDYIRSGCISPVSANLFLTGSYDHYLKLWDAREGKAVLSMNHGMPVESVIMFKTGGLCYSAGGNYIKVWDILGGGRALHQFSNHQKTITCLTLDGQHTRLLSGSLDRHVKVYDMQDYSLVANLDYPSPILSMGLSPVGSHLVVGMSDGAISIRKQPKKTIVEKKRRNPHPGTYKYYVRGQNTKPDENDVVIGADKRPPQLKKVDRCLKKFQYHDALDAAFQDDTSLHAPYIISVFHELARRNALQIALSNRKGKTLDKILNFVTKNISDHRYTEVCIQVSHLILDLYTWKIGQDSNFAQKIQQLNNRLKEEMKVQEQMMEVLGVLDTFFAMASVNEGPSKEGEVLEFKDEDAFDPAELDALEVPSNLSKPIEAIPVEVHDVDMPESAELKAPMIVLNETKEAAIPVDVDEIDQNTDNLKMKEPEIVTEVDTAQPKNPQMIVSSEDEGKLISSEDETRLVIVTDDNEEDIVDGKNEDEPQLILDDGIDEIDLITPDEKDVTVAPNGVDKTTELINLDEKPADPLQKMTDITETTLLEVESLKKLIDIDDDEISFTVEVNTKEEKNPLKELKMNGPSIANRSKKTRLKNGTVTEGEDFSTTEDETVKGREGYNSSPGVANRVKSRTKRRSTRNANGL